MLQKTNRGYYQSTLLGDIPHLRHGFSTRGLGDMRNEGVKESFLTLVGVSKDCVYPQQVHGDGIALVKKEKESIAGVDGLVFVGDVGKALSVRSADCAPILAVDPVKNVLGVAHAGWKGTHKKISKKLIDTLKKQGSYPRDMYVSIGPHICKGCYTISKGRARLFSDYIDPKALSYVDGQWHLNIGYLNYLQLCDAGVPSNHIDISSLCTSCQHDDFFSYRKDTKESFGEMVGVISFV